MALEMVGIHHADVPHAVFLLTAGKSEVLNEEQAVCVRDAVHLGGELIRHFAAGAFHHAP